MIKDRLPTKFNLHKRQVIFDQHALFCGLYEQEVGSTDHIFLLYNEANRVWLKVYAWMGLDVALPNNIRALYLLHKGLIGGRKSRKKGLILWHSVIWSIWMERNGICFNNKLGNWTGLWK